MEKLSIYIAILIISLIFIPSISIVKGGCPIIIIDQESEEDRTCNGTFYLSGVITDSGTGINKETILITIDNQSVDYTWDHVFGDFNSIIDVEPGDHVICIYAEDMAGNSAEECLTVTNVNDSSDNLNKSEGEKTDDIKQTPGFEFILILVACIIIYLTKKLRYRDHT